MECTYIFQLINIVCTQYTFRNANMDQRQYASFHVRCSFLRTTEQILVSFDVPIFSRNASSFGGQVRPKKRATNQNFQTGSVTGTYVTTLVSSRSTRTILMPQCLYFQIGSCTRSRLGSAHMGSNGRWKPVAGCRNLRKGRFPKTNSQKVWDLKTKHGGTAFWRMHFYNIKNIGEESFFKKVYKMECIYNFNLSILYVHSINSEM